MRLSREEEHHLRDVLRVAAGDRVTVFDGRGREAQVLIEAAGAGPGRADIRDAHLVLRVLSQGRVEAPVPSVTLVQAIPKGQRMDWVVEKATELGASAIVPAVTERVVGRWSGAEAKAKRERWTRLAVSAAKQCGAPWIPTIDPIAAYVDAIRRCGGAELILVGSLRSGARLIRDVLRDRPGAAPRTVAVLIGPEGDFTPEELDQACRAGAVEVSFGSQVLRTDTAALFALSVVMSEFATTGMGRASGLAPADR